MESGSQESKVNSEKAKRNYLYAQNTCANTIPKKAPEYELILNTKNANGYSNNGLVVHALLLISISS